MDRKTWWERKSGNGRGLRLIQTAIFIMICISMSLSWESAGLSDSEQVELDYEVSQEVLRCLDDGWKCIVDGTEVGGVQERYRTLLKDYIRMFYDVSFDPEKKIIIITTKEMP